MLDLKWTFWFASIGREQIKTFMEAGGKMLQGKRQIQEVKGFYFQPWGGFSGWCKFIKNISYNNAKISTSSQDLSRYLESCFSVDSLPKEK